MKRGVAVLGVVLEGDGAPENCVCPSPSCPCSGEEQEGGEAPCRAQVSGRAPELCLS